MTFTIFKQRNGMIFLFVFIIYLVSVIDLKKLTLATDRMSFHCDGFVKR